MSYRRLMNHFCTVGLLVATRTFAQIHGTWVISSQLPVGSDNITDIAKVELEQNGDNVIGTYSGVLGLKRSVQGTYDGAQISVTVDGIWPQNASALQAALSGSISADSGSGKLTAGPANGSWTARRPAPGEVLEPKATVTVDYRSEEPGRSHNIAPDDLPKAGPALTLASAPILVPRPANAWPKAPPGFQVTLYADGFITHARSRRLPTATSSLRRVISGKSKFCAA